VLIPRPETEHLVVTLLDLAKERTADGPVAIADVGTGSGVIAICTAKHLPQGRLTAIDVCPKALEVARQNAADHGVAERIEFVESDLFAAVDPKATFDFVVSNPPYLGAAELAKTARDVRRFEPRLAMEAGPTGTEVIQRLVPQALERLRPGGHLIVEISPVIHEAARRVLQSNEQLELRDTIKDLARLPRLLVARKVRVES
jgi:release factor glutamine methyltransferase